MAAPVIYQKRVAQESLTGSLVVPHHSPSSSFLSLALFFFRSSLTTNTLEQATTEQHRVAYVPNSKGQTECKGDNKNTSFREGIAAYCVRLVGSHYFPHQKF